MIGRYTGVIRIISEFDDETSADWVECGRVLLGNIKHQMLLSGVKVCAAQTYPVDGVVVKVLSYNGIDVVQIIAKQGKDEEEPERIIPLYLESGVLTFTLPKISEIEQARSAMIWRSDYDKELEINNKRLIRFKAIADTWVSIDPMPDHGARSIAVGDPSVDAAEEKDRDLKLATALFYKQEAINRFRPSLFSGKMQYFIQSIYGADNAVLWGDSRTANAGGKGVEWMLERKEITLEPDHLRYKEIALKWFWPSTVLLVTDAARLDYYLVWLVQGAARVRRLVPGFAASLLREFMLYRRAEIEPDEWVKMEGYLLGNSSIERTLLQTHLFDDYAGLVVGSPFGGYHSWTQNWDGSEARVIVHEIEDVPGSPTEVQFVARECKIAIVIEPDDAKRAIAPLIFSLEQVAETPWYYHNSRLALSYYSYLFDWLQYYMFPDPPANKSFKVLYGTAPIYGFFDEEDRYAIASFFSVQPETLESTPSVGELDSVLSFCASNKTESAITLITAFSGSAFQSFGVVLSAGDDPVLNTTKLVLSGVYHEDAYRLFGTALSSESAPVAGVDNEPAVFGTGACGYTVPPDAQTPSGRIGKWVSQSATYRSELSHRENIQTYFHWALSVPKGDVSCVYCGDFDQKNNTASINSGSRDFLYQRTYTENGTGYTYTGRHFIQWQIVPYTDYVTLDEEQVHMRFHFVDRATVHTLIDKAEIDADYYPLFFPAEDIITHAYDLPFHVDHGLGDHVIYDAPRRTPNFYWSPEYNDSTAANAASRSFVGWSGKNDPVNPT